MIECKTNQGSGREALGDRGGEADNKRRMGGLRLDR